MCLLAASAMALTKSMISLISLILLLLFLIAFTVNYTMEVTALSSKFDRKISSLESIIRNQADMVEAMDETFREMYELKSKNIRKIRKLEATIEEKSKDIRSLQSMNKKLQGMLQAQLESRGSTSFKLTEVLGEWFSYFKENLSKIDTTLPRAKTELAWFVAIALWPLPVLFYIFKRCDRQSSDEIFLEFQH